MRTILSICFICLLSVVATAQEINHDQRAYDHARREATLQAKLGRVGHFLGIAPGCRFAGVGSSGSVNRPNHCSTTRYRLVARAYAIGRNGVVYWSSMYR